jgi:hypothetical protein
MIARVLAPLLLAVSVTLPAPASAEEIGPAREPEDILLSTTLFDLHPEGTMAIARDEHGNLIMLAVPPRTEEGRLDLLLGPVIVEPRVRFP